jgi:hypothetical protein
MSMPEALHSVIGTIPSDSLRIWGLFGSAQEIIHVLALDSLFSPGHG